MIMVLFKFVTIFINHNKIELFLIEYNNIIIVVNGR